MNRRTDKRRSKPSLLQATREVEPCSDVQTSAPEVAFSQHGLGGRARSKEAVFTLTGHQEGGGTGERSRREDCHVDNTLGVRQLQYRLSQHGVRGAGGCSAGRGLKARPVSRGDQGAPTGPFALTPPQAPGSLRRSPQGHWMPQHSPPAWEGGTLPKLSADRTLRFRKAEIVPRSLSFKGQSRFCPDVRFQAAFLTL